MAEEKGRRCKPKRQARSGETLASRTATTASKIAKRPLIVAHIDQGNPPGQIIQEK